MITIDLGQVLAQRPRHVDAAQALQADVQQRHVGAQTPGQREGLVAAGRLPHHRDVGVRAEQRARTLAQQRVVVD